MLHARLYRLQQLLGAALVALLLVPAAWAQNTILIGAPLPLTGPLSPEGTKLQRGYDLWAEELNKAGGVQVGKTKMPVKIIYYDSHLSGRF